MKYKTYAPGSIEVPKEIYQQLLSEHEQKLDSWLTVKCPAHDDQKASLGLLITQEQGRPRIAVHCHAGCSNEEIYKELGLEYPTIEESYWDYKKANGDYSHTKLKKEIFKNGVRKSKSYAIGIRKKNSFDDYDFDKVFEKTEDILYNLPQVLKATDDIYLVEGEKCADELIKNGLTATTACKGGGFWNPEFVKSIEHANRIIIIPDNDDTGVLYLNKISKSLLDKGYEEVYRLNLPGLDKKEDIYDWFRKGNTIEELQALALKQITVKDLPATTSFSGSSLAWQKKLEMRPTKQGSQIASTLNNYAHILQNHPTWKGVFAENLMVGEIVKLASPIPKVDPGRMADNGSDLIALKIWIHENYPELDPSTDMLHDG